MQDKTIVVVRKQDEVSGSWSKLNNRQAPTIKAMTTEKTNNPKPTQNQSESKQDLNQKTSVQFSISLIVGILVIIILAISGYYGIVGF
ncbi:hypothetical protein [Chlorogloeopsis sp. ULAP02]|uniref:hypothetical protein n=1 Tax=Chlorogloeopsis sp. ULAP02 TaxID=3107926 RepID=UPI003134EF70